MGHSPPRIVPESKEPNPPSWGGRRVRFPRRLSPMRFPPTAARRYLPKAARPKEPDRRRRGLQVRDPGQAVLPIFNRNAPPDMSLTRRVPQRTGQKLPEARRAFRQYLVGVPARDPHRSGDPENERFRRFVVE